MSRTFFGKGRLRATSSFALVGAVTIGIAGCGGDESGSAGSGAMAAASIGQNQAPVVESVAMRPGRPSPGRVIQMSAEVSDPEGDATIARFVWKNSVGRILGEGRTFDTTGLEHGDRLQVLVTASDGQSESEPYVHKFSLAEPSIEVGFVAIDSRNGTTPGSQLRAVVESTDEDAGFHQALLEWSVDGKVVGGERDLDTTALSPGDVVELRARLDLGDRKTRAVSARPVVLTRGGAPKIISEPLAGIEGGMFRYQIRAKSDAPGAVLSYTLLEGPDGMRVGPTTGLVSWTPRSDQRGDFKVEVVAEDQWGSGIAQSFNIAVDASTSAPASPR